MSDFVAFFSSTDRPLPPESFSRVEVLLRGPLLAEEAQHHVSRGASVLRASALGRAPKFHAREDGSGWVVVKGRIFDARSARPEADLTELLDLLLAGKTNELNRYEGAFAFAAWDSRKQQGWAVNDQASMLNLYYGQYGGGLYVATNALVLARALDRGMDPQGTRELLARGVLLAPTTMFEGLRRVDIGEHIRFRAGTVSGGRHWRAYEPEGSYRGLRDAAEKVASVVVDRVKRYARDDGAVLSDLTSGFDSRLVASAVDAAGLPLKVTVNGVRNHEDVRIAHRLADTMGWEMRHFDIESFRQAETTPGMRAELLYRTNGELPYTAVYDHLLTRPLLSQGFGLHMLGSGGELLRYFPWGQEFLGIGRRRLANVENALSYRFMTSVPSPSLFSGDWLPDFRKDLKVRITDICREQPGARTTQQLDAVYVWKMTSHASLYMSSVHNWLPSVAPLLSAGVIKMAVSLPWRMRLTSQLERSVIQTLSPRAAAVITAYGGTAEPASLKNVHLEAWQGVKRGAHLARKLDRVLLKGAVTGRQPGNTATPQDQIPFLTTELRELLTPETMLSRALYDAQGLKDALSGSDEELRARTPVVTRLATVEGLCRELDFEPDGRFLNRLS